MTSQATPPVPFSERDFRDAMGSFATGVCVVTANSTAGVGVGEAIGMTVNSFSSVSLDPPLVLVCLGEESPRARAIIDAGRFNICVLSEDQLDISNHFALPGPGLALDGMVVPGRNAAPVLHMCAAVVECDLEAQFPGGDHVIVVGRVTDLHANADINTRPLLYYRSRYRKLDGDV